MYKILLHSCCAPCLTSTSEVLSSDYEVVPFWFNPNIEPEAEHKKRLKYFKGFCDIKNFEPVIIDEFQVDNIFWRKNIKGLEEEKEGGLRCKKCIYLRLEKTAQYAEEHGFNIFGTTLTVSPHKNAEMINQIGQKLSEKYGIEYLAADFKKNNGYARSLELSKELDIYRQSYCGCEFSNSKLKAQNVKLQLKAKNIKIK